MPRRAFPAERKRGLSRELIAATAMRVLDAEGLDAVTMRRIAQELGTGPASLYAHVASRDDLLAILVDRAIGEFEAPDTSAGDWEDHVRAYGHAMRDVFVRHRDLARANLGTIPTGPNSLRVADGFIGLLREAGLPDQVCAWAIDALSAYTTAIAVEDGMEGPADPAAYYDDIQQQFAALPADRYPNLAALGDVLGAGDNEERFEFGLGIFIAGLAAHRPRGAKGRGRTR